MQYDKFLVINNGWAERQVKPDEQVDGSSDRFVVGRN